VGGTLASNRFGVICQNHGICGSKKSNVVA
jgi:hypothetical protein